MKDLQTILKQEPVFLHGWEIVKKEGVISDFEGLDYNKKDTIKWDEINILFASYGYKNYSGDAFVLYEKGGKLFEVNGGHCSCYGLEGQFNPEETTLESIEYRLQKGKLGYDDYSGNEFMNELKEFLGVI